MPSLNETLQKRNSKRAGRSLDAVLETRRVGPSSSRGRLLPFSDSSSSDYDLSTVDGLVKLAKLKGFDSETGDIIDDPKLTTLQRLMAGLGSFNPAEAIMDHMEGTENFLLSYGKGVVQGIGSALTGTDYGEQTKRRYFSDIAEYMGVENKIARFGIGLVGDILLDPTTYIGGTLVRGGLKVAGLRKFVSKDLHKFAKEAKKFDTADEFVHGFRNSKFGEAMTNNGLHMTREGIFSRKAMLITTDELFEKAGSPHLLMKTLEKVSPELAAGVSTGTGKIGDVLGGMFVDGYGATDEAVEAFYKYRDQTTNLSKGLAISNMKRYGTDVISDGQWEEFIGKMFHGKQKEFEFFDFTMDQQMMALNKRFPGISRYLETGRKGVESKLAKGNPKMWDKLGKAERDVWVNSSIRQEVISKSQRVSATMGRKIGKMQELRQKIAKTFIDQDSSVITLREALGELRTEVDELLGVNIKTKPKGKPFMGSKAQHDAAIANAVSFEKDRLKNSLIELQKQIDAIESGVLEPVAKKVTKLVAGKESYNVNEIVQGAMRGLDKDLVLKDHIAKLDKSMYKLTNDMLEKQHLFDNILEAKGMARDLIKKAFDSGDFAALPDDIARALQPVSNDPKVMKLIKERIARNADVAGAAEIDDTFQVYAPSIKKVTEKDRIKDFLDGTRRLAIGSEGYKKEYRALLKDADLVKDRALFLRVEDQVATNAVTRQFMHDIIGDIGKPLNSFKSEIAAEKAGFKLMREKGMFGKEMGYIPKGDYDFLIGKVNNNFMALDAIAKNTGFDAMNSLFKRFVTGPFASFYVRNFTSGKIQNFETIGHWALHPKTLANGTRIAHKVAGGAYTELDDFFKSGTKLAKTVEKFGTEKLVLRNGKTMAMDDVASAINSRFAHSTFYHNEYNSITREADLLLGAESWKQEVKKSIGKTGRSIVGLKKNENIATAILSEDSIQWRAGRMIGNFIELNQKSEAVVGALYKGHTLDEALNLAEKAGFDYSKLTGFESHIMRRIVPFYTFTRKNIELQLKVLGETPERIQQVIRTIGNTQNLFVDDKLTEEERANLPTYLKENLSVSAGKNAEGAAIFIQGFGTPIEAFTALIRSSADGKTSFERTFLSTLSMVTPYIKAPVERAFGTESFRMRDIKDIYNAKEYKDAPQFIKNMLNLKEVKRTRADGTPYTVYVADEYRYFWARSLFTHRGATYMANIFNDDIPGTLRIMEAFSGIRSDEIDIDFYKGLTERRKEEELAHILRKHGIVAEFTKLFIPKDQR